MNTLAHDFADGHGPGPWTPYSPLARALVVAGSIFLLRRGDAPRQQHGAAHDERSPVALLGRRFAAGEIDEDRRPRLPSVLDEQSGRRFEGGAA